MGSSSSHGNDKLDSSAIKLAADLLAEPICHLTNLSIISKTFTNRLKVAKVIPLHNGKGTSRHDPQNYRPISLLPTVAKLTERVIQAQMTDFLEKTKQINYNHHAYRKYQSTTTAMLQISDEIFEATDQNQITALMTIDESTAFDCVPHHILLDKLSLYNFDIQTLEWFHLYLSYRSQYVTINSKNSHKAQCLGHGCILYSVRTAHPVESYLVMLMTPLMFTPQTQETTIRQNLSET